MSSYVSGQTESSDFNVVPQSKYHQFDCCELTRGIDTLLERYQNDREEVTYLIENDPNKLINTLWTQEGPLAIDNHCKCQMGSGERRTSFVCAQCKNMRRLIDFRYGGVNRPFKIECGDYVGKNLIVTSTPAVEPFIKWDQKSTERAYNYMEQYSNLATCGTSNTQKLECITGDSFTIKTLIMWMIAKRFREKGLPHIPTLHTSFICSGVAYSLYDVPTIGTLNNLQGSMKPEIARTIIMQLLVTLLELSYVNFSHGTPSINGLIFNKTPISYMYDGVHVQAPITLQISDLSNASATFVNKSGCSNHYFPSNVKSSMYIERNMFVPEIATRKVSMAHCQSETIVTDVCQPESTTLYRLTNSTIDIYTAMRHIGFPLYAGSFDFYCFIVALMCDKLFYDTVVSDIKLYRLWSMMWLAEDLLRIESMIKESHKQVNEQLGSNRVIDIIRGAWLRCDILSYMWGLIKMGW